MRDENINMKLELFEILLMKNSSIIGKLLDDYIEKSIFNKYYKKNILIIKDLYREITK